MNTQKEEDLRIRPVDASHISALIRIGEATKLSPWSAESYLDELKNPDAVMLRLVDEDNSIIGFIVGRIIGSGGDALDAEIYNIAVKEREQRRGRGQILLDAFVEQCNARDVSNIWLEVRESNEKAIRFYTRNGFERVQTRRHFYTEPREHALLMRASLNQMQLDNLLE